MQEFSAIPYDQYMAEKTAYETTIKKQQETIAQLTAKVDELEKKLNINSRNSNKPPSSDGYKKPKNLRIVTGKKVGAPSGHEGKTLELKDKPDETYVMQPKEKMCTCGGNIKINETDYIRHQVIDIPEPRTITKEYRQMKGNCEVCGKEYHGKFPEDASGTMQYGNRLKAFLSYVTIQQLIPLERATDLFADLFGANVSEATLINTNKEISKKLEPCTARIKEEIINSNVTGFDETGMRVAGHLEWLHVASTKQATYYQVEEKRGKEAMDNIGILPIYTGNAVHDHLKSYYKYELCAHAECNAHILRYLIHLYEGNHKHAGRASPSPTVGDGMGLPIPHVCGCICQLILKYAINPFVHY
jgi:transposase